MFRIILQNIINLIKLIALLFTIYMLINLIFFQNPKDYKSIGQYVTFLVVFVTYFIKIKKKPVLHHQEAYENTYKVFLEGAFSESKSNYQKLIKCADLMEYRKYKDTHKLLDSLEFDCVQSKDYLAVHTFRALCYDNAAQYTEAITYYRKALGYDMSIAALWNNLGLCYLHTEQYEECKDALSNALLYDIYSTPTYANMAKCLLNLGQPEAALHYTRKGLEIAPNDTHLLFWAALAYAQLNDTDNMNHYSNLYIQNGGSKSKIKSVHKILA